MAKTAAVILAAGKGTRMCSEKPKVLHRLGGKYLIQHVIDETKKAGIDQIIIVIGHGGEIVQGALGEEFTYAWQREQLGTGHAVMQGLPYLAEDIEQVLVLSGDVPMLKQGTIKELLNNFQKDNTGAVILTAEYNNPTGYGRIVRDDAGKLLKIVEDGDASPAELKIKEINSGTYCFNKDELITNLNTLTQDNAQGEYYLTDIIEKIREKGFNVIGYLAQNPVETMGINNRVQLAEMEKIYRTQINEKLMLNGVTIIDPASVYIDEQVEIGQDTIIHPFTLLQGETKIGSNSVIGPNVTVENSIIGNNTRVRQTVMEAVKIADDCNIGPFSYLRPGTIIGNGVRIGDFVEIKNTRIADGSKIPHLTYIGDSQVGKKVNIGAGTITCNYDGKNKFETIIEDEVFIGSNSNLIAPIKIGKAAFIAAGSTLNKDIPPKSLAIARTKQRIIENWKEKSQKKED